MKRLVLKVGTSTLTGIDGKLDKDYIDDLCRQVVEARALGWKVVVVSSGAIRAGADRLDIKKRPRLIPEKQAAAAVGQGLLHQIYTAALDKHGVTSAQVLLTRGDFADHTRYVNAGNTLRALLRFGAVPVINENDTVSVDEIRFGDNDMLAAMVAHLVDASLMVLLTDVDGLCTSKPKSGQTPDVIPLVNEITPEIEAMASGGESARGGTGGMSSKLAAARTAVAAGIPMIIAPGRRQDVVTQLIGGARIGTTFRPAGAKMRSRKRWMAFAVPLHGEVRVNRNAADVLVSLNRSLLPVGIIGVSGQFESGDLVSVVDDQGVSIARGFINYKADDVRRIMGKQTSEIEETLGHKKCDEVIHRDNLVLGV